MSLQLDTRQRNMLAAMGVRVWLPVAQPVTRNALSSASAVALGLQVESNTVFSKPQELGRTSAASKAAHVPLPATIRTFDLVSLDAPALVANALACEACALCAGRKNSTLSLAEIHKQADWLVVGDPPDEEEDRAGRPFVQEAGILLDNMLKAVGVSRADGGAKGAYVSNVVKCRPPYGRIPKPSELAQCAAYLQREIALVRPKVIVAMGRFAMQTLLHEHTDLANAPLGKLRGSVYHYQGVRVVVTYHPKALLHNSADKAKAWADLCLAMDVVQSMPINTL